MNEELLAASALLGLSNALLVSGSVIVSVASTKWT
jgi:hypothetical protein